MQIVYIGAFRFPTFDAAAARVLNIGRALRDAGHEVTFISWGGKYMTETDDNGKSEYDGFTYYISGELNESKSIFKLKNKFSSGCQSIRKLRQIINNVDLIIAYNPDWNFNKKLLKLSKQNRVKYAVDLTEWYDNNELKITDYLPNWINMTKTNSRKVHNRILISSFLDNYYITGNNVVIPATCNSKDSKWICKDNDGSDFDGITLIYAGIPAKKDKLHEVINAVEKFQKTYPDKIRLLILGIDKSAYLSRYSNLIESNDLSSATCFWGRVSQDMVPKYYAQSDFMVLLRDSNRKSNAGFPTKFAESMMSGTPVIANLTSDLGQYLKNGANGFIVEKPTSDSIYDLLKWTVTRISKEDITVLHNNAKETGLRYFDYRNYCSALNEFIKEIR